MVPAMNRGTKQPPYCWGWSADASPSARISSSAARSWGNIWVLQVIGPMIGMAWVEMWPSTQACWGAIRPPPTTV